MKNVKLVVGEKDLDLTRDDLVRLGAGILVAQSFAVLNGEFKEVTEFSLLYTKIVPMLDEYDKL